MKGAGVILERSHLDFSLSDFVLRCPPGELRSVLVERRAQKPECSQLRNTEEV